MSSSVKNETRFLGIRHLQVFMLFICLAVNYLMRINITTAIVLMTDLGSASEQEVFDWSMVQKSTVLSSFHLGYFPMNLGAAWLVTKFSNKNLLLISVAFSSILTIATPVLTIIGDFYALLAVRFLSGFLQGFMMAVTMGQLSRWIPPDERSRCGSLVLGGINFGTMISYSISGWLGGTYGWPSIFYFSGGAGLVWSVFWVIIGADSPSSCWLIGEEEKIYIEKELLITSEISRDKKIPYKDIFSNKACWALLLTTMGHNWGNWTLLNEMPSYFDAVIHLSSTANGLISALPHGCLWVFSFFSSYVSDLIIKRKILSVGACRKISNSIGQWGAAIALLVLSYSTHEAVVFAVYTIGITLLGFVYIGYNINHLDIIPEYAGFFMGITNGMSTIPSIFGTEVAGIIISDPENQNQWRLVFGISSFVFFLSNLIFITLGSGEVQPLGKKEDEASNTTDSPTLR